VRRRADGVDLWLTGATAVHPLAFDRVVLACHADQALSLLADPTPAEREQLAAIRYQPNRVVLHTDRALMPNSRRAWSAWNYLAAPDPGRTRPVAVTYWLNKLQPLPFATPVLVTLNPPIEPAADSVLAEFEYAHPLHDSAAVSAQSRLASLQGAQHTWYAGAWLGYGFHEDGLVAGYRAADGILAAAVAQEAADAPREAIAA
jgi:predicted NAD/FAD-binding protein